MSRRSALRAFTDYVNFAALGSHWTRNPRQPLCTPLWRHALIIATLFMRCHRRRLLEGCIGCWTLPPELLVTLESSIMDWRQYYTTSSIGWMSRKELSTSLVWRCTGVCMDGHLDTSQITSSQPLMLLLAVIVCILQTWTVSLCLAADLARMAAGLFIMLARQSGTRCQTNSEILTASIVLNGFWKQSSLAVTSVTSALEVIF